MTSEDLGSTLYHAMTTNGIKTARLARSIGVSEVTVRRWISGQDLRAVARYLEALRLCGLHVTVRKHPDGPLETGCHAARTARARGRLGERVETL